MRDKGLPDNDPALECTDLLLKGSIGSPPTFTLGIYQESRLTVLLQFDLHVCLQKFRIAHYFKKLLLFIYISGR